MRLITDRPVGLPSGKEFILMGVIEDAMVRYACLVNAATAQIHIEEIYWTRGIRGNEVTANLRSVDDDQEWKAVYRFVTEKTTILSPKKLKAAIQIARSRGVTPRLDEVVRQNYPYAHRQVDPSRTLKAPLPPAE